MFTFLVIVGDNRMMEIEKSFKMIALDFELVYDHNRFLSPEKIDNWSTKSSIRKNQFNQHFKISFENQKYKTLFKNESLNQEVVSFQTLIKQSDSRKSGLLEFNYNFFKFFKILYFNLKDTRFSKKWKIDRKCNCFLTTRFKLLYWL